MIWMGNKRYLVIAFDDEDIEPIMAVEAIKGFELDWAREVFIG